MKRTLIHPTDTVFTALSRRSDQARQKWGADSISVALGDLVELTYDGRRVRRNHDLVDAIKRDARFIVGPTSGVHFADVRVSLA